jgi:hypothetical protein
MGLLLQFTYFHPAETSHKLAIAEVSSALLRICTGTEELMSTCRVKSDGALLSTTFLA